MPRSKGPKVTADDWRSDTQRVVDAALAGTWWRCRSHGLTTDPLLLGPSAYCPRDECSEAVLLVHRVSDDKGDARWNDGPQRKPGRPRRVDQVDEDARGAGPADDAEPEPSDDDGGPAGLAGRAVSGMRPALVHGLGPRSRPDEPGLRLVRAGAGAAPVQGAGASGPWTCAAWSVGSAAWRRSHRWCPDGAARHLRSPSRRAPPRDRASSGQRPRQRAAGIRG